MSNPKPFNKRGSTHKSTLLISQLFKDAGFSAENEAMEAMLYAKEMTKKGGNWSEKGTDQAAWAALWLNGAIKLLSFVRPTMSAIAVKDLTDQSEGRAPLTTAQALAILANDPFLNKDQVREVDTAKVVDAVRDNTTAFKLPEGKRE